MKHLRPLSIRATQRPRPGAFLIEATVAIVLLGVVMALVVPVLSRTSMIREQVDRREIALDAVANLLERASRDPKLTEQALQAMTVELIPENRLPLPEWKVTLHSEPPLQRVEASLTWQHRDAIRSSVKLARWYPGGQP